MAQLAAFQFRSSTHDRFAIEMSRVTKSYGPRGEKVVYSNLQFQLLRGTFVAYMGPIGSGKSTMINMFAGLERPTSGTIFVQGEDITAMDDDTLAAYRARTVGVVPQVQTLIPELTVRENVELPMHFAKSPAEDRRQRVDAVLEKVGISRDADRTVGTMSVGERQMVSVARALVNDPPILLLDEPTEALDPLMAQVVLGLLRGDNMTAGKTIFVTTHDRRVTDLAKRTLKAKKTIP